MSTTTETETVRSKYPFATFRVREHHPIADIFPMMGNEEALELARDISRNGMAFPIVLFEDKVLDGRNRQRAAAMNNYSPQFINFAGTRKEALDFAFSSNVHRRHLNSSQIALIVVERENLSKSHFDDRILIQGDWIPNAVGDDKDSSIFQYADKYTEDLRKRTNHYYIKVIRRMIREKKEDTIEKVRSGELSIKNIPTKAQEQSKKRVNSHPVRSELVQQSRRIQEKKQRTAEVMKRSSISKGATATVEDRPRRTAPRPEITPLKQTPKTESPSFTPPGPKQSTTLADNSKPDLATQIHAMIGDRKGEYYPAICNRTEMPVVTQLHCNPFGCESAGLATDVADSKLFRMYVGRWES